MTFEDLWRITPGFLALAIFFWLTPVRKPSQFSWLMGSLMIAWVLEASVRWLTACWGLGFQTRLALECLELYGTTPVQALTS